MNENQDALLQQILTSQISDIRHEIAETRHLILELNKRTNELERKLDVMTQDKDDIEEALTAFQDARGTFRVLQLIMSGIGIIAGLSAFLWAAIKYLKMFER